MAFKFDVIGYWSELKLDILHQYASAYSTIMTKHKFHHLYVDAFAGAGIHLSKRTGEIVKGSPLVALEIQPPFKEYYFIELNESKATALKSTTDRITGLPIHIFNGNCNRILLERVFPQIQYEKYRRALCLLDPYGLHLDWQIIEAAGKMKTIDMLLNFPVADMNRNVLWSKNVDGVDPSDIIRMNAYWGNESWREAAYSITQDMFGEDRAFKETNRTIAAAFRKRLLEVGGFKYVPEPLAMQNSKGADIYYLFFASQEEVANKISRDIFMKYRR